MDFPERIKNLRLANGLSQKEMAQKLFVSQQAVSRWETGASYPDVPTLKLIATTFNIKIDELLGDDYAEAKQEKKVRHSPLFHVLLWAGAILCSLTIVLLILYFVSGSHFDNVISIVLLSEIGLLFLAFIPALFHLYRQGTRKTILISLIIFAFFAAFSWGCFFTALRSDDAQNPTIWTAMGYALFLSATAVFLLLLYLRSQQQGNQPSSPSTSFERIQKKHPNRLDYWGCLEFGFCHYCFGLYARHSLGER
jgi:transcriptional regulator with XRE-family HTH domain